MRKVIIPLVINWLFIAFFSYHAILIVSLLVVWHPNKWYLILQKRWTT